MKNIALNLLFLLSFSITKAQITKSSEGFYTDASGNLFTGLVEQKMENESKFTLQILNGKEEGEANYFYASGKIMEKGNFSEGKKSEEWKRYSENGNLIGMGIYLNGKKNGNWLVWDDKGNKLFEMNYENGEKSGTWQQWDVAGNLVNETVYGIRN